MPTKSVARKYSSKTTKKAYGDYSKNWVKWVVIYLLVGGLVYLAIYALFLQKGYNYSTNQGNTHQQTTTYP